MRSLLSTRNIKTPAAWWSNASTARLPSFSHKARSSPALFVREERARADALSAALINKCRASGKLAAYRNAFLQAYLYFHARGLPFPAPAIDLNRFLSLAVGEAQTISRTELYITSLAFIHRLNEWDIAPLRSLRARAPVQAAVSIFSTATRKSAPVRGWMIRDVLRLYCFGPSATLASIVFGAALAAMYHVWGRYDAATQLRYGGDSMVWHRNGSADPHWVDLYVNKHKNR